MALVVEDGSGLANAESYIAVADADARHSALGNTAWAGFDTTTKEQLLRQATEYMLQAYRDRWQGYRQTTTQALDWPRNSVIVDEFVEVSATIVPTPVKNACADLALRASSADLAEDLTRGVIRSKVGPIETEYDRASPQGTRYRAVEMALAPFLKGSSSMATLVRR